MIDYIPKNGDFVGKIKREITNFINNVPEIDDLVKDKILRNLGCNYYDERFDVSVFIPDAVRYSVSEWKQQNFDLAKLWQEVAVKNAAICNAPYDVANATVEEFKKQFNIES